MTATETRRLIAYFRDCLLEDGGERQIVDVFAREEREQHLFACEPDCWTFAEPLQLDRSYGKRIAGLLRMQRQERELLLGACLVSGPGPDGGGRSRRLRAPLILCNAELIEQDGDYRLCADSDSLRLNPVALDALGISREQLGSEDAIDYGQLAAHLEAIKRRDHVEDLASMPRWRAGSPPFWMATGIAWLSSRSQLARSVAYELDAIASPDTELSPPLRQILGEPPRRAVSAGAPVPETLPTSLTAAQERCLGNAASEVLSVINGPPGTGKTYTLACQAIDRLLRNERVLIVCSNEHAADVVRSKLATLFGDAQYLLVRAGRANYRQELLTQLASLLAGEIKFLKRKAPIGLRRQLALSTARYRRQQKHFQGALGKGVAEGRLWLNGGNGAWGRLRRWWLERGHHKRPLLSERWDALQESLAAHQQLAHRYLIALAAANIAELLRHKRKQLVALSTALRSRSSGNREEHFDNLDWEVLTQTFPIWIVSAQALYRVLPLKAELFDLVIIDEATQCNLSLALPALQRASRAVVVGDPKQLRHFSFLSRARQTALARRHEITGSVLDLDYRERSLLDYALAAVRGNRSITLLDEHFRSHPTLIEFSNQRFYDGRLKVLTNLSNAGDEMPVEISACETQVAGEVNEAEIEAVLNRLDALIAESDELPDHECPSIGVLAFFRTTALRLEKELLARFDLQTLGRHELRAGTPFAFQGEERDIMLLATGVYPGRAAAAWNYLNRPEVFNVAVTRARHRQIVFIAEGALDSASNGLLADYLHYLDAAREKSHATPRKLDHMRAELVEALESRSIRCRADYAFAGNTLDLLALHEDRVLGIDTIGADSAAGEAWSWDRYRLLERAGLPLFPVSYLDWNTRKQDVIARLQAAIRAETTTDSDAKHVHSLRWRLQELGEDELLGLLTKLEAAQETALHWLATRFDSGELTYRRYEDSIIRLRNAAITELEGAAVLLEGLRELDVEYMDSRVKADLHSRTSGCRDATKVLEKLAAELALLRTSESTMDDALAEVGRLAARVSRYGTPEDGS